MAEEDDGGQRLIPIEEWRQRKERDERKQKAFARSKPVDPITLQGKPVPERRWLVRDWIPWGTVTGLYGAGGEGKSLLLQQLLTCAALGRSWLGLPTVAVRAYGLFFEDSVDELHRRQADINRLYGCEFGDLENLHWISHDNEEGSFIEIEPGGRIRRTPFFEAIVYDAIDFGAQLVAVDTVAHAFVGNENDRSHVTRFISMTLGRLARATEGCVVATLHPSRVGASSGEGDGGSTAWSASMRSRLYLHRPAAEDDEAPDPDLRVLSRKKANYAAREDDIRLRWQSGVLVPAATAERTPDGRPAKSVEDTFLDLLDESEAAGRPVSESRSSPSYAPKLFARSPRSEGFRVKDFERAMEQLFSERAIQCVSYGYESWGRRKIVRTPVAGPQD